MRSMVVSTVIGTPVVLATLVLAAPPESLTFVGDVAVDIEGIYEESLRAQRLDVTLTKVEDGWLVAYVSADVSCRVKASGPRDRIVIAPNQTCTTEVSDEDHRGTVVAHVIRGALTRHEDGSETFELSAHLRAEKASRHVVKDTPLGRIDTWVPLGTRRGVARFEGKRPRGDPAPSR